MTIETKKVASVNEAISIINRLNYTNETFHYKNSTFSDDYKVEYRFCDGVRDNDSPSGMSIIEIVTDGTLQTVRFFNHFRDIAVDLRIGDFMPDYDRFDTVINVDTVDTENETVIVDNANKESAPADDFETKLAELQAIVDAAQANYDAKDAEFIKLQRAIIDAKNRRSHAYIKLQAAKRDLDVFVAVHKQAEFLWDKIQCESKPLDDDNVWDLLPKVDELNDVQDDEPTPPYKPQCTWHNPHNYGAPGNLNFDPNDRLRAYLNPVDDLNNPPTKPTPEYKPQCTWENPHTIVMKTALLRCQIACQVLDIPAALNELKLFATYRDANKVELEEEPAPTPKRARQIDNNKMIASKLKKAAKRRVSFINRLNDAIKSVEEDCAFNQVCYDEPDDSRERVHFDAELKQLIAKGLRLIQKRDKLATHRDRLYLTIEKLDAQAI